MHRLRLVLFRMLQLLPVLVGISVIAFLLLKLSPGDPVRMLLGDRATEEAIAAVRERYGLDEPLLQQYLVYMKNLLAGDLGQSIRYRVPVEQLILEYLPRTLLLLGYVLALTLPTTIVVAIIAARHQGRWPDQVIRAFSVLGMTVPVFWLGIMLSRFFGVELGWFPVSGYGSGFIEHLYHLFLPALSTAVWFVPILLRNLRAAIIEQMEADYVVGSRSKGLPERYIFLRQILMNSLLPTLHLLGVMVAALIGGTVIVEIVYAVPGLGSLMISSVIARDYAVVQGLTLYYAFGTILVTLAIDILTTLIDPRVEA